LDEKRKAEIALSLTRHRLKQAGGLSDLLRGGFDKTAKETGISKVEIFNFVNTDEGEFNKLDEERKAEIALTLVRHRLKQTGELSDLLRGSLYEIAKETEISEVEIFKFVNWEVKVELAKNPNTSEKTLLELIEDEDEDIRRIASASLNQRKK